jgi:hypothetical protein
LQGTMVPARVPPVAAIAGPGGRRVRVPGGYSRFFGSGPPLPPGNAVRGGTAARSHGRCDRSVSPRRGKPAVPGRSEKRRGNVPRGDGCFPSGKAPAGGCREKPRRTMARDCSLYPVPRRLAPRGNPSDIRVKDRPPPVARETLPRGVPKRISGGRRRSRRRGCSWEHPGPGTGGMDVFGAIPFHAGYPRCRGCFLHIGAGTVFSPSVAERNPGAPAPNRGGRRAGFFRPRLPRGVAWMGRAMLRRVSAGVRFRPDRPHAGGLLPVSEGNTTFLSPVAKEPAAIHSPVRIACARLATGRAFSGKKARVGTRDPAPGGTGCFDPCARMVPRHSFHREKGPLWAVGILGLPGGHVPGMPTCR